MIRDSRGNTVRAGFAFPARTDNSNMNLPETLRFLDYEARRCRERDAHEALCLLLPALTRIFHLPPMEDAEAFLFRRQLRDMLYQEHIERNDFRRDPNPSKVGCGGPT